MPTSPVSQRQTVSLVRCELLFPLGAGVGTLSEEVKRVNAPHRDAYPVVRDALPVQKTAAARAEGPIGGRCDLEDL